VSAGPTRLRTLARWALGLFLVAAGGGHFLAPEAFLAQTPTWLPAREAIVLVSGSSRWRSASPCWWSEPTGGRSAGSWPRSSC
jgi:hypothetical protein